jgi:two-component system, NarL family, sensor histidine kinase DesK
MSSAAEPPPPSRRFSPAYGALAGFLAFTAFPIVALLTSGPSPATAVVSLAAVAIFVVVYVRLIVTTSSARLDVPIGLRLGALWAIALALSVFQDGSWLILFAYVSAAAGFCLSDREAVRGIAVCAATVVVVGLAGGYHHEATASFAIAALGIGFMMSAFRRLLAANKQLRAARHDVARLAATEERLRIARDVHDLLGHSLSVIALKSELAGKLVGPEPERAAAEIHDVTAVSRRALADVREAVGGYRRMRLADELDGARTALASAGIECAIDAPSVSLPDDVENVLAWTVREGATNVVRHSGARSCAIRLRAGLREVELELTDDGGDGADGQPAEGSGLAGLAERAERLNGRLEAGALPHGGFRLRVTVPAEAR